MKHAISAVCALLAVASFVRAEAPAALDADTIIKKATEALGGKAKAPESISVSGTLSVEGQNLTGKIAVLMKGENAVVRITLTGLGQIQQGVNGDIAYETSELMGARLLTGEEKRQVLAGLSTKDQLNSLEKLKDPRVTGPVKLEDGDAWQLTGKGESGEEETHWIDTKSFLPLQEKMTSVNQMGKMQATMKFRDYKEVAGGKVPMTVILETPLMAMRMKFTDVKANVPIDDKEFALPADVKKLVEKSATKPATQPDDEKPGAPSVPPALP